MRSQVHDAAPSFAGGDASAGLFAAEKLKGWLPVDAVLLRGRPHIKWMDLSGVPLVEPFFHQTVEQVRRTCPERTEQITDVNALIQFEKFSDSLRPTGFIFHASRCGSTLVSNACRALDGALVFAEPYVVDKLMGQWFPATGGEGLRAKLWQIFLRGAVSALGQRRGGGERHFVIKFACSGTLHMERVRRLWPDVPRVFVYRDPVEIMVSNLNNVPDWMRVEEQPQHTAAMLGVSPGEVARMSREEFCARSLGRFYAAAAEQAGDGTLLLAYDRFSAETLLEVVRFFGAAPTADEIEKIKRVSRLYSKDAAGRRTFDGDAASKRDGATPLIREMAERWAREPYECLRRKHGQGGRQQEQEAGEE